MLKPLNFTPPPDDAERAAAARDAQQALYWYAEAQRLRALLTEANTEILYWRKQAQHWHDKACPDRTKPFTVGVEE